jgi:hypothetical protein
VKESARIRVCQFSVAFICGPRTGVCVCVGGSLQKKHLPSYLTPSMTTTMVQTPKTMTGRSEDVDDDDDDDDDVSV